MKKLGAATTGLDESARTLKAFADPVRLRLMNLLSEGREVCVRHLHEALELPQSTVSRHLACLRKSGMVAGRKEGLRVHYKLARIPLGRLGSCLGDPEIFGEDLKRLDRAISRRGGGG